VEQVLSNNTQL